MTHNIHYVKCANVALENPATLRHMGPPPPCRSVDKPRGFTLLLGRKGPPRGTIAGAVG